MHIILQSQTSDARSVLCVSRESNHAEIIEAEPEHMDQLVAIARALGVDQLTMTINAMNALPPGWYHLTETIVIAHEL